MSFAEFLDSNESGSISYFKNLVWAVCARFSTYLSVIGRWR